MMRFLRTAILFAALLVVYHLVMIRVTDAQIRNDLPVTVCYQTDGITARVAFRDVEQLGGAVLRDWLEVVPIAGGSIVRHTTIVSWRQNRVYLPAVER